MTTHPDVPAVPDFPAIPDLPADLTPARIALGRAGGSVPTASHLQFRADHARARDAVGQTFDADHAVRALTAVGRAAVAANSAAQYRDDYIRRPDLGRTLSTGSAALLARSDASGCDLVIVLCDGLSPRAIDRSGPPLVERIAAHPRLDGWAIGPTVVVRNGRVAIGDEIGELLDAAMVVVLIGERPGLTISESVGAYVTVGPRVGRTDADRNCISNIHERGTGIDDAARQIVDLVVRARVAGVTGVALPPPASFA